MCPPSRQLNCNLINLATCFWSSRGFQANSSSYPFTSALPVEESEAVNVPAEGKKGGIITTVNQQHSKKKN